MNLLDAVVEEVIGPVYTQYGKWWVKVKYNCEGQISQQALMFDTEEAAKALKVGHKFLT